jgi:hypothetical protein
VSNFGAGFKSIFKTQEKGISLKSGAVSATVSSAMYLVLVENLLSLCFSGEGIQQDASQETCQIF